MLTVFCYLNNSHLIALPDSSPGTKKPSSSLSSKKHSTDRSPLTKRSQKRHDSDSDQSPPRKRPSKRDASDSDQSPPRRQPNTRRGSDSDQSPPRRRPRSGKDSEQDLSPPRKPGQSQVRQCIGVKANIEFYFSSFAVFSLSVCFYQGNRMLSGGKAGLVSVDILRKEQEENRRREKHNQPLEGWFSFFCCC